MNALMALLVVLSMAVAACHAQTLVQFSPSVRYSQNVPVAAGFAYAFHAPVSAAKSFDSYRPNPYSVPQGKSFESLKVTQYTSPAGNTVVPVYYAAPTKHVYHQAGRVHNLIIPQVVKTQYHSQDELGQYAYGYVHNDASHHEERTLNGRVTGSYSYYDDNGIKQYAKYVADRRGYRIQATNLPVAAPLPVQPTPEVQAATIAHLKAVSEVRARQRDGRHIHVGIGETPEVAAARAAHMRAFNKIKREHSRRWKRSAHHTYGRPSPNYQHQQHSPGNFNQNFAPHSVPVPVTPTPAVQAATYAHLQAVSAAHHYGGAVNVGIPHTPEVAAAREAHFYAYDKIQRDHARRWKRSAHHSPVPQTPHVIPNQYYSPRSINSVLVKTYSKPVTSTYNPKPRILNQYHSQNENGQYQYGYSGGTSSKHEQKGPDGVTRGHYSFVDAYGSLQRVDYEADSYRGFRIISTTTIPQPIHRI